MNEDEISKVFPVACCRGRRSILPGGILFCRVCDTVGASSPPNGRYARDVPAHVHHVDVTKDHGGAK